MAKSVYSPCRYLYIFVYIHISIYIYIQYIYMIYRYTPSTSLDGGLSPGSWNSPLRLRQGISASPGRRSWRTWSIECKRTGELCIQSCRRRQRIWMFKLFEVMWRCVCDIVVRGDWFTVKICLYGCWSSHDTDSLEIEACWFFRNKSLWNCLEPFGDAIQYSNGQKKGRMNSAVLDKYWMYSPY